MAAGSEALLSGLILAALSAFFNGTFSMFGKLCKKEPDPIVFNTALTFGALISSLASVALQPAVEPGGVVLGWSWFGALAGALFVFATLFSFIAIPLAGLAVASATWGCSAMVVAFLWGAVGPSPPRKPMKSVALSMVAIVLLVLGVLIINRASQLARLLCRRRGRRRGDQAAEHPSDGEGDGLNTASESSSSSPVSGGAGASGGSDDTSSSSAPEGACAREVDEEACTQEDGREVSGENGQRGSVAGRAAGILSAVVVGAFGGSILVPAAYVSEELKGLRLLPSFGVAAAVVGLLVSLVYWVALKRRPLAGLVREFRPEVLRNGILSGIIWNLGNICQVIAQSSFDLSYGIAYPMLQCALLFSGVWGIYFFKEEPDRRAVLVFWAGAAVLICGVVLLGLFGPGAGGAAASGLKLVQSPQELLAALELAARGTSCDGARFEVAPDLYGTVTYYDASQANGIMDIGGGKPMTWLSGYRTLERFLNDDVTGCCGAGSMANCLCKIAEDVGIIDTEENLSYLKPVPPYKYVYVGLRAEVTNQTNPVAGGSVSTIVPTWDALINTLPTLMPVVLGPTAAAENLPTPQCNVSEDVRTMLKTTPYEELFSRHALEFARFGATATSCTATSERQREFLSLGEALCVSPAAVRSFLCTYLDANPLFTGDGLTSGGTREYVSVPTPLFSSVEQGLAEAEVVPFDLPFTPGSRFRCLKN